MSSTVVLYSICAGVVILGAFIIHHYIVSKPKMDIIRERAENKVRRAFKKIEEELIGKDIKDGELREMLSIWQEKQVRKVKQEFVSLVIEHKDRVMALRKK